MSKIRQRRTAEQIRHILSELFLRQLNDPRLQGLTITDVKIDRELQYANIYVNALGDEARQQEVMASLDKAVGFLRRELSGRMRLRSAPQLKFHWDPTLAHAEEINQLLDSLDIPPEADDRIENDAEQKE
jgi:ribosome-binding factor A